MSETPMPEGYNYKKLGLTVAGAILTGVVGHGVLPEGWDAAIVAVVSALAALHIEPPHK